MLLQNGDFGIETSIYATAHLGRFVSSSSLNPARNIHNHCPLLPGILKLGIERLVFYGKIIAGSQSNDFENNFNMICNLNKHYKQPLYVI